MWTGPQPDAAGHTSWLPSMMISAVERRKPDRDLERSSDSTPGCGEIWREACSDSGEEMTDLKGSNSPRHRGWAQASMR